MCVIVEDVAYCIRVVVEHSRGPGPRGRGSYGGGGGGYGGGGGGYRGFNRGNRSYVDKYCLLFCVLS